MNGRQNREQPIARDQRGSASEDAFCFRARIVPLQEPETDALLEQTTGQALTLDAFKQHLKQRYLGA